MRNIVRYLYGSDHPERLLPYVVLDEVEVRPGDLVINGEGEIVQCNQSTCVWFTQKVVGKVNQGVKVVEGEEVTLAYDCLAAEKCGYPWCSGWCPGSNPQFRIQGKESRKY